MTKMETGTRTAITATVKAAVDLSSSGTSNNLLAAMEMINGARHILAQSMFIADGDKAIMDDQLWGIYLSIKSSWKEAA